VLVCLVVFFFFFFLFSFLLPLWPDKQAFPGRVPTTP
jgi:hypothetical protein